jgi:hypothetical protein
MTEFAQYRDIQDCMAANLSAAHGDAEIVLETTARGMNQAYHIWIDEYAQYHKLFFAWFDDPTCRRSKPPKVTRTDSKGKKRRESYIPPEIEQVAEEYDLDQEQRNWAANTYLAKHPGDWDRFCQEYPPDPESAFITTGNRVFPFLHYKPEKILYGEQWLGPKEPSKFRTYILGVDSASGSADGDFSAAKLADVTNEEKIEEVWSFYERLEPKEYADQLLVIIEKFDPLVVIETNNYGLDVQARLREMGVTRFYTREINDKKGGTATKSIGWWTSASSRPMLISKLLEFFRGGKYVIRDPRLKHEIPSFIWGPGLKAIHEIGAHDDMILATGLVLMGLNQVYSLREEVQQRPPQGIREKLLWEAANGLWSSHQAGKSDGLGRSPMMTLFGR